MHGRSIHRLFINRRAVQKILPPSSSRRRMGAVEKVWGTDGGRRLRSQFELPPGKFSRGKGCTWRRKRFRVGSPRRMF